MAEAAADLTPQVASQTLDAVAREVGASLSEALGNALSRLSTRLAD